MFQIFFKKIVTSTKICKTKIISGQKFITIVKKCNRKTKFETYFFKKIGSALFWFFGLKNISEHLFFEGYIYREIIE